MELLDQIDILKLLELSHYFKSVVFSNEMFCNEIFCNFVHYYTDHIFRLQIRQVVFLLVE